MAVSDQGNSADGVQNEAAQSRAEKAANPRKSRRVLDGPTHLYKHYDKRFQLLYVGISLSAIQRLKGHKGRSPWFNEIARIHVAMYPTRTSAKKAEARLIKKHQPPYNVMHTEANSGVGRIRANLIKKYGSIEAWSAEMDRLHGGPYPDLPSCLEL